MSLRLSLHDAARNCERDGATATLTLRSGAQFTGKLNTPSAVDGDETVHMLIDNGWATIRFEEIAAVAARRPQAF